MEKIIDTMHILVKADPKGLGFFQKVCNERVTGINIVGIKKKKKDSRKVETDADRGRNCQECKVGRD